MWGRLDSYFCHMCLAPKPINQEPPGVKFNDVCFRSRFAFKTIEQMSEHLIAVHGYSKPKGYDEDKKKAKNKAKAKRRRKKNK